MADKRRDSRGRLLHTGEIQKSDGRYEYRYKDNSGTVRSVYSWRLVATDATPHGKRFCEPLRDLEKQIQKDIEDDISTHRAYVTLQEFFDNYMKCKISLKYSTAQRYKYEFSHFVSDKLKNKRMCDIKRADIKAMYVHLIDERGVSKGTVSNVQIVLHQLFESAVLDNIIRSNPTNKILSEIDGGKKPVRKNRALTPDQQKKFIEHCREKEKFRKYVPLFTVIMWTGCRIGEISGLRWDDCDFDNDIIHIRHSVSRIENDDHKTIIVVTDPKTENGKRDIPMIRVVKDALLHVRDGYDFDTRGACEFGGLNNFVFLTNKKKPISSETVRLTIREVVKSYNKKERERSIVLGCDPEYLPEFSCHALRHTFCTRLIESDANIKAVQHIMGHANISTTMDIYAEVTRDKTAEEMQKIDIGKYF